MLLGKILADRTRRNAAARPPITSHRLFPATVIVWFAALFGLVSLAIRPRLLESAVLATGVAQIVPMAAPPLGTTTRILLALLMTLVGCLVGALVARQFARPAAVSAPRRPRAVKANVTEADAPADLEDATAAAAEAEDADGAEAPFARRRRQLAIMPEPELVDERAPLPGTSPILTVAELELDSFDADLDDGIWLRRRDAADWTKTDPVGSGANADDVADNSSTSIPNFAPDRQVFAAPSADEAMRQRGSGEKRSNRLFDTYVLGTPTAPAKPEVDHDGQGGDTLPSPGFELLEALPSGEQASAATQPPHDEETASSDRTSPEGPAPLHEDEPIADAALPSVPTQHAPSLSSAAERIASAPLDALSHVELLERLAITIARRRAARMAQPVESGIDQDGASAGSETAMPAQASVTPIPAALRPVPLDAEPGDDDVLGFVPARHIGSASFRPSEEAPSESELSKGYMSLRGLKKASDQDTAHHDADQARAFDAPQAQRGAVHTEKALREALTTLQRMSGAA